MLDEAAREDLIEQITALFSNEANATEFNEDPDGYVAEHLPEGTEAADVASCMPSVAERTGLDFSNVASTATPAATAASQLSTSYQTIYQQNSFIYAEEGSQVTNIQGDGNAVAQQDVDVDLDVDYGRGDTEEPETPETPETDPNDLDQAPRPDDPGVPEDDPGDIDPNLSADDPVEIELEPLPEPEPEAEEAPEPELQPPGEPMEGPMDGME
jgi:hypothetical protein